MKNIALKFLILFVAIFFISCTDKSVDSNSGLTQGFSYTSSKCMRALRSESISPWDSSFVYKFSDTLFTDFSVPGNCCPDSNRFVVYSLLRNDTILVTVVDTAEYGCRCICTYFIHTEHANLQNNHYVVHCVLVNIDAPSMNRDTLHLVDVYRMKRRGN